MLSTNGTVHTNGITDYYHSIGHTKGLAANGNWRRMAVTDHGQYHGGKVECASKFL